MASTYATSGDYPISTGDYSGELQTFFDSRTLEVAEMNLALRQFAVIRPLPARHSKTIKNFGSSINPS
jgi:hypothetical protein